ncbi:MAG: DNA modification methylase [Candidatus Gastranaerophilales bacterium]|nr:DNA modification methylase [Candidatus Gastranaerophilales bacterium]
MKKLNTNDIKLSEKLKLNFSQNEIAISVKFIKKFGLKMPILINTENEVVVGENLFLASQELGLKEVPVVYIENLSKKELKAFKIASKRILSFGEFNEEELKFELKDLLLDVNFNFDCEELGFTSIEFDNLLFVDEIQETKEKEEKLELNNIKELVKYGDIIQLGKHKLLCGDSLNPKTYEALMGEKKADIIISDPPYNLKIQGNVTSRSYHNEFQNASGEMSEIQFQTFLNNAFNNVKDFSKENSLHYIFIDWRHCLDLQLAFKDIYPKLLNVCIWDKTKAGMGSFYRSQHEFCFVYQNGSGAYSNNIQLGKNGRNRSNIWQYQGMNLSTKQANKLGKLHPTVKSTAMIADIILDTTKQGDLILDNFGGSGTTLIAAEQTNRVANLIEISPSYCDVIIYRWEELTGLKHTKIGRIKYGEEKEKQE